MWALCAGALIAAAGPRVAAAETFGRMDAVPAPRFRPSPEQTAFLDQLERDTFRFFWDASTGTGLTPDRFPGRHDSSVAAIGFALTSYVVGVERGYVSRADAAARTLATLERLWRAPQGAAPEGFAGYQGLFYHFIDPAHAVRAGRAELSTVDTALLMAGVLSSQAYFDREDETERSIRVLADILYRRVNWAWASSPRNPPLLSMGWNPESGFLDVDWRGYNEGMLVYLLALGSPTHPVAPQAWEAWAASYRWDGSPGTPHLSFPPLFGHQYSHAWIDFRGIQDRYMRDRGSDYFTNSVHATYANRAYCVANPGRWSGYDGLTWGLTASDGPPAAKDPQGRGAGRFHAYWARGADPGWDDGTIAPTAVGGSVPFAPEVAIPTLVSFRQRFGDRIYGEYGFRDAFNLSYPGKAGAPDGWFSESYLGIDQGPILLMVENYRSGLIWELLKRSPYVVSGLRRAGFTGGWLEAVDPPQVAVRASLTAGAAGAMSSGPTPHDGSRAPAGPQLGLDPLPRVERP